MRRVRTNKPQNYCLRALLTQMYRNRDVSDLRGKSITPDACVENGPSPAQNRTEDTKHRVNQASLWYVSLLPDRLILISS